MPYATVYLASNEASYVTGSNLVVDGGFLVSGGVGRPKVFAGAAAGASLDFKFN